MKKFEFVSYDGEYPCLCYGKLTIKDENGNLYHFDSSVFVYKEDTNIYPSFWVSGGCICDNGCNMDDDEYDVWTEKEPWKFDECRNYPDFVKENKDELIKLFNENVPFGCCGGCI